MKQAPPARTFEPEAPASSHHYRECRAQRIRLEPRLHEKPGRPLYWPPRSLVGRPVRVNGRNTGCLLKVEWVVEQTGQPDTAMPELRIPRRRGDRRATRKVRRRVVGREQHEGIEEHDYVPLRPDSGIGESITRLLGLAPVAQDHVFEGHATTVVPVRPGAAHSPERGGQELRPERAVEVPLVEVRAEVMALEVGED